MFPLPRQDYKEKILTYVKSPEVKVTFDKVEDIYNLHKMFQIELGDRMENWNEREEIGSIYTLVHSIFNEFILLHLDLMEAVIITNAGAILF